MAIAADLRTDLLRLVPDERRVSDVESVLEQHGADLSYHAPRRPDVVVYPESSHGFHADYRPSYNKADADDAWKRCTGWFDKYLKG